MYIVDPRYEEEDARSLKKKFVNKYRCSSFWLDYSSAWNITEKNTNSKNVFSH